MTTSDDDTRVWIGQVADWPMRLCVRNAHAHGPPAWNARDTSLTVLGTCLMGRQAPLAPSE
jgi:hypothetical protein